jgi:hypothetical protein
MTELFNHHPRQDLEWTPPAPLHVKQARDAIEEYKAVQNSKDAKRVIEEAA